MIQQEGGNLSKYNLQKQRMTGQSAYQYKLSYWSMDERDTKAVVLFPWADARKSGLLDGALFPVKVSRGVFYREAAELQLSRRLNFLSRKGRS